ncbi:MAG: hypothetical protein ACRCU2_32865 [Planktothrix sp.]
MNLGSLNFFTQEDNLLLQEVQTLLKLSSSELDKLRQRLWAFSALVRQPRKDDRSCNKTPFFYRWTTDLKTSYLTVGDPRYASLEECHRVFITLVALLLEADQIPTPPRETVTCFERVIGRQFQASNLLCVHTQQPISGQDIKRSLSYTTNRLGAYEIPVSYRIELNQGGCHQQTNVGWMKPLHINYQLRNSLRFHLQQAGVPAPGIKNTLDKVQVKAYCTDKVTMPPHFSNRDIRWATWPSSIQYASHYQCALIEMELMAELYEFWGAPLLDSSLSDKILEIRGTSILGGTRKCFVTGRSLTYDNYVQSAINPRGGKSNYHVGHLIPLTRGGTHRFDNIAWASDDGNRIQGNDTLEEIESKLIEAVEYHLRRDMALSNHPSPSFHTKIEKLWTLLNDIREYLDKSRYPW